MNMATSDAIGKFVHCNFLEISTLFLEIFLKKKEQKKYIKE